MRITAGKFKGRVLNKVPYSHIRPTADVVKQAMFNKLAFVLPGARVLDLFCGSGALGIEAISRGAGEVIFVDKDSRSVALTKDNLKNLGITASVLRAPFESALKTLTGKFDIIILDPPYKSNDYTSALMLIEEYGLLAEDGIIVCEHDKHDKLDPLDYQVVDEKIYGLKCLTYLKKQPK